LTEQKRQARQLPRAEYRGLKAVWRELVKLIGSEALASRSTRVSAVQVGRYGSVIEEFEETFAPIDIVADLEAEVGPLVTRELARLTGHLLVQLPPGARDVADLGRVTGRAMKEVGDVFAAMGKSLDDGVLQHAEGAQLLTEIDEAMTMLATLRLMVVERMRGNVE
jgi:hypothetical protein